MGKKDQQEDQQKEDQIANLLAMIAMMKTLACKEHATIRWAS
jgi:hypothetical protein